MKTPSTPTPFNAIAFDADDTLWHNESLFALGHEGFRALLAPYLPTDAATLADTDRLLYATETRNLARYGYGIKGFTLSMIETAVEVTGGRVTGQEIKRLLDIAHEMLAAPVELLDGAAETIAALNARDIPLLLITKGDLFDQEGKLARSGLGRFFRAVEIVSEKNEAVYRAILTRHGIAPERFLMVGNSVRSDILPVLGIGGRAVHIPYHLTWEHEVVPIPPPSDDGTPAFLTLATLRDLLPLLGLPALPDGPHG